MPVACEISCGDCPFAPEDGEKPGLFEQELKGAVDDILPSAMKRGFDPANEGDMSDLRLQAGLAISGRLAPLTVTVGPERAGMYGELAATQSANVASTAVRIAMGECPTNPN